MQKRAYLHAAMKQLTADKQSLTEKLRMAEAKCLAFWLVVQLLTYNMKMAALIATWFNSLMSPLGEVVYWNLCPTPGSQAGRDLGRSGPGRGQGSWYRPCPVPVLAYSDLCTGKTVNITLLIKS